MLNNILGPKIKNIKRKFCESKKGVTSTTSYQISHNKAAYKITNKIRRMF